MGVAGRDWMRERSRPLDGRAPLTWWLVTIVVLAWFVLAGAARDASNSFAHDVYGALAFDSARVLRGEVWRLVTALMLHAPHEPTHVLFNMILLFVFGREVEALLGSRRYALLLLASGLAGTVLLTIVGALGGEAVRALGASGAVYGAMAFAATCDPRRIVHVFGVLPMRFDLLVGVLIVVGDLLPFLGRGRGALAAAGHLAGAAVGFAVARWGRRWPKATRASSSRRSDDGSDDVPRHPPPPDEAAHLDSLLDKIHRDGLASLTAEERAFLDAASKRRR